MAAQVAGVVINDKLAVRGMQPSAVNQVPQVVVAAAYVPVLEADASRRNCRPYRRTGRGLVHAHTVTHLRHRRKTIRRVASPRLTPGPSGGRPPPRTRRCSPPGTTPGPAPAEVRRSRPAIDAGPTALAAATDTSILWWVLTPPRDLPITSRRLGIEIYALGALIGLYALLGPLAFDVIHFRTSASGLDQVRGGDLAALLVVVPVCVAIGRLAWRGHPAAPVLALAPATFATYTHSQLALGNEYLIRPGNIERFFPLFLVMFVLAAGLVIGSWMRITPTDLPVLSDRMRRGSGVLLVTIAAFVVVGLHLPTLVDALRDEPTGAAYVDAPTLFWVVKFYDLAILCPAAITVGVALLRGRPWAQKPAYAILGGYALLAWSVAGMGWSMVLSRDPDASIALAIGFSAAASALTAFAYVLYRQLFGARVALHLPPDGNREPTTRLAANRSHHGAS